MTKPSMVVVDFETTGLSAAAGVPLELGMLLVDDDLNVLHAKALIIQPAVMPIWSEMDPFVVNMHTKSGLIEEVEKEEGLDVHTASEDFIDWLEHYEATKLPMCGSSVAFDRGWMQVHMPDLARVFHYRNVDVSTVKELCRRWNPRIFDHAPKKRELHRSLSDCYETVDELAYYRDEFFFVAVGNHAD